MKTELLLMMLAVVLVKGEPAKPHFNLQCYKKTTDPDSDFICAWESRISADNFSLFYHAQKRPVAILWTGRGLTCKIPREMLLTKKMTTLWLEAKVGNRTYRSLNLSVVLETQVKYDAPEIKKMSRSSGNLTLWWDRQNSEDKGAIHEIAFRKQGDDLWQNNTFETRDGGNAQEEWTESLPENECYEVRIRRMAKGLGTVIWSDWSNIKKVPIEICSKPKVTWEVGELKMGVRLLKLTWKEPQKLASFGGVSYKLSIFYGHCWRKIFLYNLYTTKYNINVTASAVNLNITAINSVGESPTAQITVPAQHLNTCSKSLDLLSKNVKKFCVELYNVNDEKTPPASVKTFHSKNITHAMKKMKKEMEDFVRYHYFIHVGDHSRRTIALCPFYKKEEAPASAPVNVTVLNKTHNSALLQWKPIPMSKQHGFLKHYIIYIERKSKIDIEKVSWLQTNYTVWNLSSGTEYTVNITGETDMGLGPNATIKIQMFSSQSNQDGKPSRTDTIISVTCLFVLCSIAICSFAIKSFISNYLPDIPRPVIQETHCCSPENDKETYPVGEEVDVFVFLPSDEEKGKKPDVQEERATLVVSESSSQEQEDSECQSDSDTADASCFALSPDYKRQVLSLQAPLEGNECGHGPRHCDDTTPSYKNGLVFEGRTENTRKGTEL
ncbi:interleukin-12 receptor subunit beta-1 [Scleropages formosus]|uniref:Fibronectin type-III domain-containing protein n=1 Tax=Scleropages formosus TaxID=113540 RepID=A0A8C9SG43_SCLFO|nr:interleukin-12 receptor subunit beta-1 [Scleropages formosus]